MDGGGGEVILSGRERERERVMVVATTSPPLIFLSLNFDLSLRFCSCKGRQCGELRDGDCTLLTLRQPCRIFQHCPSLYGSCSYHAMSSVHCIINCRTRLGPCTNRPPSSEFCVWVRVLSMSSCSENTQNQSQTIIKSSTHKC